MAIEDNFEKWDAALTKKEKTTTEAVADEQQQLQQFRNAWASKRFEVLKQFQAARDFLQKHGFEANVGDTEEQILIQKDGSSALRETFPPKIILASRPEQKSVLIRVEGLYKETDSALHYIDGKDFDSLLERHLSKFVEKVSGLNS